MRPSALGLILVIAVLAIPGASAATSFQFQAPTGWTEMPSASSYQATDPNDPQNSVFAVAVPEALAMDAKTVDEETVRLHLAGIIVKEIRIVEFDGARVIRYLGEQSWAGVMFAQLGYILPGNSEHARIVFTTRPELLPTQEATFDAAARSTRGIVGRRPTHRIPREAAMVVIAATLAATYVAVRRRFRRSSVDNR
jgi:hypothetical protein